jgi:hypothetical protein
MLVVVLCGGRPSGPGGPCSVRLAVATPGAVNAEIRRLRQESARLGAWGAPRGHAPRTVRLDDDRSLQLRRVPRAVQRVGRRPQWQRHATAWRIRHGIRVVGSGLLVVLLIPDTLTCARGARVPPAWRYGAAGGPLGSARRRDRAKGRAAQHGPTRRGTRVIDPTGGTAGPATPTARPARPRRDRRHRRSGRPPSEGHSPCAQGSDVPGTAYGLTACGALRPIRPR